MSTITGYLIKRKSAGDKKYPLLHLEVADNFLSRFRGLMLRGSIGRADGLLLSPCNSVHMCFMRFPLDIVYLDGQGRILKIVPDLKPWRGMSLCLKAKAALELPAGKARELRLQLGDIIAPLQKHPL